ncbi:MAG: Beta-xylosidase [Candidatus Angelobacter sp.]|jgi:xylan 1,4-beta-xylosidase|nr:Beta-xylosidase [Candidatus Angelobacter sp.]
MRKTFFIPLLLVCLSMAGTALAQAGAANPQNEVVRVDLSAPTTPFPHYWEQMFGSGRAVLTLRDSYRRDLKAVRDITGFQYVRFHAIFHDEVGVYDEDAKGAPIYNFSYVDQIYDGLLENGVRPFVEIGFMPKKLAAYPEPHAFWYKPSPSPPKDFVRWDALVTAFAKHLIDRYGADEVGKWYFEVWNEPNIDFWTGNPKQETYFEFYDHTAKALKAVSQKIRVGGPATAQAAWADVFIAHVVKGNVPADFVSTHVYANDTSKDVFGTDEDIPRESMVCRAVKKVHDQIKASAKPNLPLIWSEYNASYKNETDVTDSHYMAAWLPNTISQCDGLVDTMAYWTFSDVFEEQGVIKTPFYGGFGLLAEMGVPKPAFNTFKLMHKLGDQRIKLNSGSALLTRRADGTFVMAAWNLVPWNTQGAVKQFDIQIPAAMAQGSVKIYRVDATHGNVLPTFKKMGSPNSPTAGQWKQLRSAGKLPEPETAQIQDGHLKISVPSEGLAVIEIK